MPSSFFEELARFGPNRSYGPVALSVANVYCRRLATTHYENFSVASAFLPRNLIQHFHNIYAYCRWADDLADEAGGGAHALELLRWWRSELMDCYENRPHHPVMVALNRTVRLFDIPSTPFLKLLFAFEQDQLVKSYANMTDLMQYCAHSANPVGHLVLYLCRSFNAENARLSDYICSALQLANFWQDVARDYQIGRVYLPESERIRFGYTEEDLRANRYNRSFIGLMAYLVDHTKNMFLDGYPLIERMPPAMSPDIELFAQGGLGILKKIQQQKYDVWKRRPKLSKWDKIGLGVMTGWKKIRSSFQL